MTIKPEEPKLTIKDLPEEYQKALLRDTYYSIISLCWPAQYWTLFKKSTVGSPLFYHNTFNGFWEVILRSGECIGGMGTTARVFTDEDAQTYTFSCSFTKWDLVEKRKGLLGKKFLALERFYIEKEVLIIPKREVRYLNYKSEWVIPDFDPHIPQQ